jgi:iron complex outermembrane receptor protein
MATIDIAAFDAAGFIPGVPPQSLTTMLQMAPRPGAAAMAEKALSLEAGWRKQLGPKLSLDSAVYVNDYSDLRGGRLVGGAQAQSVIGLNPALGCMMSNPVPSCYFTLQGYNTNQDKLRTWGGEFAVDWHPTSQWRIQGSYAYLKVQGAHTGDLIGDMQVKAYEGGTPQHQFSLRSNYSFAQGWNLDVWARHVSKTSHYTLNALEPLVVNPYASLDARLAWQMDRQLELAVMGKNLLTNRHTEFVDTLPYTRAYDVQRTLYITALWRF